MTGEKVGETYAWTPTPIISPGVYTIPAEEYHADPVPGGSLSASGALKLLPPHCPAFYHYELAHPPPPRKTFDVGHAAHRLVLGIGPELELVDRPRWDTNEVKAQLAEIRERGGIPLHRDDFDDVHAMAAVLREHPYAALLFSNGEPEQSLFWVDDRAGIWRRARLDFLPNAVVGGRLLVADYKTCVSASPAKLGRVIAELGYHCKAAWYLDGLAALGFGPAQFVWVFQEKTKPHLVTVAEVDTDALQAARALNWRAIELYRECRATGRWHGYGEDEVVKISLPPWADYLRDEGIYE